MDIFNNIKISAKSYTFVIKLFWIIILASFIAWIVGLIINPQGHQLDVFFLRMSDFWGDATVVTHLVHERNPYQYQGSIYPPLPYLIYYLFACVSRVPDGGYSQYFYQPAWTMLFVIFIFVNLEFLWHICSKQFQKELQFDAMMIGLAICLSGPMLFAFERGNTIILTIVAITIYIFYYDSDCNWEKELALICLAIASNIKLSPVVFGALLVYNRDWKSICKVILYGILLFFLPFFFFEGGTQNLVRLVHNINSFVTDHVSYSIFYGTGLPAGYFQIVTLLFGKDCGMSVLTYLLIRVISLEISLLLFLGVFHIREKWKQVLNLTLILLILPSVSHEYNILFLIPTTILFLKSFEEEFKSNSMLFSMNKLLVFLSFIMMYFVYRCPLSDFFDQRVAVLILTATGFYYSIKAFKKSNHILPIGFFCNRNNT